MARGGGHHSHRSSHRSSHHHYHRHHHYRYGSGNGEDRKSPKAARIIFLIYLLIIFMPRPWMSNLLLSMYTGSRTPLPQGTVVETDYYLDEAGYLWDEAKLTEGLEYFYKKTGVQPFVYFTRDLNYGSWAVDGVSNINSPDMDEIIANSVLDTRKYNSSMERMEALYDTLFEDEGHFLLIIICSGNASSGDRIGISVRESYYYGAEVDRVMDERAINIFFAYYDKAYESQMATSPESVISSAFTKTADKIMKKPYTNLIVAIWAVAIIGIIIVVLKKRKNNKVEKEFLQNSTGENAGQTILYDDMPEEWTPNSLEELKKKPPRTGGTISWEDAMKDMEEAESAVSAEETNKQAVDGTETQQEERETAQEDKIEIQTDFMKIPEVDWGFSLGDSVDLFKSDKEEED